MHWEHGVCIETGWKGAAIIVTELCVASRIRVEVARLPVAECSPTLGACKRGNNITHVEIHPRIQHLRLQCRVLTGPGSRRLDDVERRKIRMFQRFRCRYPFFWIPGQQLPD